MPMEFINQNILLIALVVVSGVALLIPLIMRPSGKQRFPGGHPTDHRSAKMRTSSMFARSTNTPPATCRIRSHSVGGKLAEQSASWKSSRTNQSSSAALPACVPTRSAAVEEQGFLLHNLAGGVDAWVGAGYPIRKAARKMTLHVLIHHGVVCPYCIRAKRSCPGTGWPQIEEVRLIPITSAMMK